jgi:hypothetical protein
MEFHQTNWVKEKAPTGLQVVTTETRSETVSNDFSLPRALMAASLLVKNQQRTIAFLKYSQTPVRDSECLCLPVGKSWPEQWPPLFLSDATINARQLSNNPIKFS